MFIPLSSVEQKGIRSQKSEYLFTVMGCVAVDPSQWLPPSEHQSMCLFISFEGIMSSLMHKCTHCMVKRRVASSPPAVQRPRRTLLKEQWELPSVSTNQIEHPSFCSGQVEDPRHMLLPRMHFSSLFQSLGV